MTFVQGYQPYDKGSLYSNEIIEKKRLTWEYDGRIAIRRNQVSPIVGVSGSSKFHSQIRAYHVYSNSSPFRGMLTLLERHKMQLCASQ